MHELAKYEVPSGRGDMIETYKYTHGLYSENNNALERDAESTTRGHKYKLKKV